MREARVFLAPVAAGAGDPPLSPATRQDLGLAQVAIAGAFAVEGLTVTSSGPAEAALWIGRPASPARPGGSALDALRPRVILVPWLDPTGSWRGSGERHAVVDEAAAVAVIARGVAVERIAVVGWPLPTPWHEAAAAEVAELRERFAVAGECVVLVDTRDLDEEELAGLLVQLSLVDGIEPLFDAPDEAAAAVLRERCPRLGLRARRFGVVAEAPLLWRACDLVVGRPRPGLVAAARLLGMAVLALGRGEGDGEAAGVTERGLGRHAASISAVAGALETLRAPDRLQAARAAALSTARPQAAAAIARLVADVVRRRDAILAEHEPSPLPPSPPSPAGPLEEVGISADEREAIEASRRFERQEVEQAERELDDRLAALKARLKPDPP